jgi:hypothetical protein
MDHDEADRDLTARLAEAWGIVHEILDAVAKAQRGLLRRRARPVRIHAPIMETITDWTVDYLIPVDEFEVVVEEARVAADDDLDNDPDA